MLAIFSLKDCIGLVTITLLITGCSSQLRSLTDISVKDPWERMNRASFAFNQRFKLGKTKMPKKYGTFHPVTLANNIMDNAAEVPDAVNHLLQGRPKDALDDSMRLAFNSTFGLAGVFDVASEMGIPKIKEDFGQTLGYWGVGAGNYVVLPFIGPTLTRDLAAKPLDASLEPFNRSKHGWVAQRFIPTPKPALAEYKPAQGDAYTQQRAAWLHYRANEIAR